MGVGNGIASRFGKELGAEQRWVCTRGGWRGCLGGNVMLWGYREEERDCCGGKGCWYQGGQRRRRGDDVKAGEPGQIEGQGGRGKEAGARKLDVKAGRGAGLGGVRKCMGHGCWGLAKRISYVRIFHPSKRKRATRLSIHPRTMPCLLTTCRQWQVVRCWPSVCPPQKPHRSVGSLVDSWCPGNTTGLGMQTGCLLCVFVVYCVFGVR